MRKNKSSFNITVNILSTLLAICFLLILVLSFTEVDGVPVWKDVYSFFGLKTDIPEHEDYITFLSVGEADSILIRSNGETALIDTATAQNSNAVYSKLKSIEARGIDLMVLTHCHEDHYGGAEMLSQKFRVLNLITPEIASSKEDVSSIKRVMANVLNINGNCYTAKAGMNSKVGDFEITVLSAPYTQKSENDRSIILMAEIDDVKFLLMADAGKSAQKALLKENLNLDCDVLKLGHHGSADSTSEELLSACTPQYAVISCGVNNQYNHPDEETLNRLEECNASIYRTDLMGDVTFIVDDGNIKINTQK